MKKYTQIGLLMCAMLLIVSSSVYAGENDPPNTATSPVVNVAQTQSQSGDGSTVRSVSGDGSPASLSGDGTPSTGGTKSPENTIGLKNPLKVKTVGGLIQTAVEIFSYVVILFAVLAFIWVGFRYILARGNPEEMKKLSGWLGYIVIGVAVVIGARVIISIVINTLEKTGVVDQRVIQSARDASDGN